MAIDKYPRRGEAKTILTSPHIGQNRGTGREVRSRTIGREAVNRELMM